MNSPPWTEASGWGSMQESPPPPTVNNALQVKHLRGNLGTRHFNRSPSILENGSMRCGPAKTAALPQWRERTQATSGCTGRKQGRLGPKVGSLPSPSVQRC